MQEKRFFWGLKRSLCLKIVNENYLDSIAEKLRKMQMKIFIINNSNQRLSPKYPGIKFSFYVSRRNKYVRRGLDKQFFSLDYSQIISDIAEMWE